MYRAVGLGDLCEDKCAPSTFSWIINPAGAFAFKEACVRSCRAGQPVQTIPGVTSTPPTPGMDPSTPYPPSSSAPPPVQPMPPGTQPATTITVPQSLDLKTTLLIAGIVGVGVWFYVKRQQKKAAG